MTLLSRLEEIRRAVCVNEDDTIIIRLHADLAAVDITIGSNEYSVGICVDDDDDSIIASVREILADHI